MRHFFKDLCGQTESGVTIASHFLKHDGGGNDGSNGVAAGAAMADRIAVDLVDHISLLGEGIKESVGVDRASLAGMADPRIVCAVGIWAPDRLRQGLDVKNNTISQT